MFGIEMHHSKKYGGFLHIGVLFSCSWMKGCGYRLKLFTNPLVKRLLFAKEQLFAVRNEYISNKRKKYNFELEEATDFECDVFILSNYAVYIGGKLYEWGGKLTNLRQILV